ncbi:hypothetical protein OPT61_g3343 [Boeremia exigua]|uniref:Uncharacterized protein n=1 Tax=Boeremia exigua TaxID=749465 RepID=A0ACC2II58_9PLEO|nr:hypothetical protein OPT61_g3343 [Boeremia exigua]
MTSTAMNRAPLATLYIAMEVVTTACSSLVVVSSCPPVATSFPGIVFSVPSSTPMLSVTMPPTTNPEYILSQFPSPPLSPIIPSQPPLETLPELFYAAERPQRDAQLKNRIFNYYFLVVPLLVAAIAALLWYANRQRRRNQEQMMLRGQHAIPRDVERCAVYRRYHSRFFEGLDESGEAPPPYKLKDDAPPILEASIDASCLSTQVAIPERALLRGETDQIPNYTKTPDEQDSNTTLNPPVWTTMLQEELGSEVSAPIVANSHQS